MKEYLSAVIENTDLRIRLGRDIQSDRLPHALIFEGEYGTGKHTIAKMCAAALVCEEKSNLSKSLPCLSCPSCKKVLEDKSPDVIYINSGSKSTIGVDAIRFLREDVSVIPNDFEYKSYIIENADKMTPQAQNALLLTLEEPPKYVHFFLLCENSELLLETIRSRAPTLRTEAISIDEIDSYICEKDRRAMQMKLSDSEGYAELLAASGNGIGLALEYLDPKVFAPIKQMRTLAFDFVSCAVRCDRSSDVLSLLSRFSNKRDILSEQLKLISDAVRDLLLLKKSDTPSLLFFADTNRAMELSDRVSIDFLFRLSNAVMNARDEIGRNANVRLCLVKMAINSDLL